MADLLLYPSSGLGAYFDSQQPTAVFPPAGLPNREYIPPAWELPTIVYMGGASFRYGSDLLLAAMEQVVACYPTARCCFITHQPDYIAHHPARHASWLTVESRTFAELPEIMRSATLMVSPLRINSYNNLAVPVKLFDYMSFGRPIIATVCRDTAALIGQLEAGLVVEDTVESLSQGIIRLLKDHNLATRLGQNGYQAIQQAHSWPHRAEQLLQMIENTECEQKKIRLNKISKPSLRV
jgi:glycosyltransferase involved in cell wall biosynthesis